MLLCKKCAQSLILINDMHTYEDDDEDIELSVHFFPSLSLSTYVGKRAGKVFYLYFPFIDVIADRHIVGPDLETIFHPSCVCHPHSHIKIKRT